jgi:hypothetical protein
MDQAGTEKRQTGGRRAPGATTVVWYVAAAPPVLSAPCEWHLTSRLYSPHALDSSPDQRVRLGPSEFRHHGLVFQLLAHYIWMREAAEARPVLAWCGL